MEEPNNNFDKIGNILKPSFKSSSSQGFQPVNSNQNNNQQQDWISRGNHKILLIGGMSSLYCERGTHELKMLEEKSELQKRLEKLEKSNKDNSQIQMNEDKKKRHRRGAKDIERHYRCPVEECQKSYGSEGSLAQHIKLKHNDFYKTISANISQTLQKMKFDEPKDANADRSDESQSYTGGREDGEQQSNQNNNNFYNDQKNDDVNFQQGSQKL